MESIQKHLLISITFVFGLWACETDRNKGGPIEITMRNNSNDTIVAATQNNFPDTTLQDFKSPPYPDVYALKIGPNSEDELVHILGWKEYIKKSPENTLMLIIYSVDSLNKHSFDRVQKDYMILKRYDLTIQELEQRGWSIDFP